MQCLVKVIDCMYQVTLCHSELFHIYYMMYTHDERQCLHFKKVVVSYVLERASEQARDRVREEMIIINKNSSGSGSINAFTPLWWRGEIKNGREREWEQKAKIKWNYWTCWILMADRSIDPLIGGVYVYVFFVLCIECYCIVHLTPKRSPLNLRERLAIEWKQFMIVTYCRDNRLSQLVKLYYGS